ncbi:MAG TPA: cation diffusion facilitator family transporter [Bacteroidia bacterium]|jgi:cation diffusion facilitator family transporter|nr:cation diffusion facilitator family transporter [Bacteroidia bacterium]
MSRVLLFSVVLTLLKFLAWHLTRSQGVLTDALESIINVVAGLFALFSTYYASRPRDEDHPYGHGKIEYLSAGFEGGLIFITAILIIIRALQGFFEPSHLQKLDTGLYLLAFSGLCNYAVGTYLLRHGRKLDSHILMAEGKHLVSDTVASLGILAGLLLIFWTGYAWIDNLMALLYGAFILRMGFHLLKSSVTSLLDEADTDKLTEIISLLNTKRHPRWIDIHKLRVLKYGSHLHVDCHVTLPWYATLEEAHTEVQALENLIREGFDSEVEFFIHSDPCIPSSCPICPILDCRERKQVFVKQLDWTPENLLPDQKHKAG